MLNKSFLKLLLEECKAKHLVILRKLWLWRLFVFSPCFPFLESSCDCDIFFSCLDAILGSRTETVLEPYSFPILNQFSLQFHHKNRTTNPNRKHNIFLPRRLHILIHLPAWPRTVATNPPSTCRQEDTNVNNKNNEAQDTISVAVNMSDAVLIKYSIRWVATATAEAMLHHHRQA